MTTNEPRFILTSHLCRHCGTGRVLQHTNAGPTGGGNPVYRCAACGAGGSGMTQSVICWCNQIVNRGGLPYETRCLPSVIDDYSQAELIRRGWRQRALHYGLSVWWRYAPEESTSDPDFERAERFLETGELPMKRVEK